MDWLTTSRKGRIILHLIAMLGDHAVAWHLEGITRELNKD